MWHEEIGNILNKHLPSKESIEVLDAGCGDCMRFNLNKNLVITGIDISKKSIEKNENLAVKIIGDITEYNFIRHGYDIVVCWDVLEHVSEPLKAVENMMPAVKDGGWFVIAFPNVYSLKGLLTKFTPHLAHIWIRRYTFGDQNAGKTGYGPFPTYLRFSLSGRAVTDSLIKHGFSIETSSIYEGWQSITLRDRHPILYYVYRLMADLISLLSFNKIQGEKSDVFILARSNDRTK